MDGRKQRQRKRRMEANLGTCSKHIPWTRSDEDHSLSRQNKEVDLCRSDCAPLCLHHRYYHSATKNSNHSNHHALQKWKIFKIQATHFAISVLTLPLDKRQLYDDNERKNAAANPGEGPGSAPPPLMFRPNWGPKGRKMFFLSPGPSLLGDRSPAPPPPPCYLKFWIRHWTCVRYVSPCLS